MSPLEELAHMADVPIDVEVVLDRRPMTMREVLALEPGSTLRMGRAAGENVDMYLGEVLLGTGEIVVIEQAMGVRITDFTQ